MKRSSQYKFALFLLFGLWVVLLSIALSCSQSKGSNEPGNEPAKEKTNQDYFIEIPEEDKSSYGRLLNIYEHVWYGEFDASDLVYGQVDSEVHKLEGGDH